jgi:hypothetical protein
MSYEDFIDELVTSLKISFTRNINTYINNECKLDTSAIQNKTLILSGIQSHYIDGYDYDKDISCSGNPSICREFELDGKYVKYTGVRNNNNYMVCDYKTQKCKPSCRISSDMNMGVTVDSKCIGTESTFIRSTKTDEITFDTSYRKDVVASKDNIMLQRIVGNTLDDFFKARQDLNSKVVEGISNTIIKYVSDTNITQKCSSSISVNQDQNVVIQGDIYCTPDSIINIGQHIVAENYVKCIFSSLRNDLLANNDLANVYKSAQTSDCVCDRQIKSACDSATNTRSVQYTVLKPATGNGKCTCTTNTTKESCEVIFSNAVCAPTKWSDWSDCTEGYQYRTREIHFGDPDCAERIQWRPCEITNQYVFYTLGIKLRENLKWLILFMIIFLILIIYKVNK